jgi:MarR family transcriptional regulator, organic hydroperoxide resistance regulator
MSDQGARLYLDNQLCFPLYAASRLTTKIYAPLLKELDLTYPQYLVMLVLWQHADQSVNAICDRLLLESNTVTPLLKRLEQKKLLSRRRSNDDERKVMVSLTAKGDELRKQALSIPEQIIDSFDDEDVTEKEIREFQETLWKLVKVLNAKVEKM